MGRDTIRARQCGAETVISQGGVKTGSAGADKVGAERERWEITQRCKESFWLYRCK